FIVFRLSERAGCVRGACRGWASCLPGEFSDDILQQARDGPIEAAVGRGRIPQATAEGDGADGKDGAAGTRFEIDDFAAHQSLRILAAYGVQMREKLLRHGNERRGAI